MTRLMSAWAGIECARSPPPRLARTSRLDDSPKRAAARCCSSVSGGGDVGDVEADPPPLLRPWALLRPPLTGASTFATTGFSSTTGGGGGAAGVSAAGAFASFPARFAKFGAPDGAAAGAAATGALGFRNMTTAAMPHTSTASAPAPKINRTGRPPARPGAATGTDTDDATATGNAEEEAAAAGNAWADAVAAAFSPGPPSPSNMSSSPNAGFAAACGAAAGATPFRFHGSGGPAEIWVSSFSPNAETPFVPECPSEISFGTARGAMMGTAPLGRRTLPVEERADGRRRRARSALTSGTSLGGFQAPRPAFQIWTSPPGGTARILSISTGRRTGPVCAPSPARYHSMPSSTDCAGWGRGVGCLCRAIADPCASIPAAAGMAGDDRRAGSGFPRRPAGPTLTAELSPVRASRVPLRVTGASLGMPEPASSIVAPVSRTVMTFSQLLHRTFSTFPRTFSSAIEYFVWQRSQTNFMLWLRSGSSDQRRTN